MSINNVLVAQGDDVVELDEAGSTKKNRRMPKPPITKDEAISAISKESSVIRDAVQSLTKMHEQIVRTVNSNVDLNFSLKDEAKNFLEVLEETEKSTKRILQTVVARCRARIDE